MATFDVINLEKQKVGTIDLSDAVYAAPVDEHLFYEVVKAQMASRRAGTVGVKNRSLVSGGGKKPYKQKGTGRARQGSIRASQWVGGGKAMAPKMRDHEYHVPKKVRKAALRAAISKDNQTLFKSVRNAKRYKFLPVEGANVYDILRHQTLLLTRDAALALQGVLA